MGDLFFWISKLAWFLISPDSLLVLLLCFATILLWKRKLKWASRIVSSVAFIVLIIALFPIGEWLLHPLETRYPANPPLEKVDGIIVLSGAISAKRSALWKQTVVNNAAERLLASIALTKKYPEAKLVFTGGSGSLLEQQYKGADAAKKLYQEQGLDTSKILFERESRNTAENASLSKAIVKPKANENWVLITTAWHMPRSVGIFCKQDWSVIPYPVDFRSNPKQLFRIDWRFSGHLHNLKIASKEWLGILSYSLTGKTC